MTDVVKDYAREYAKEYAKELDMDTARRLFENGVSYELVKKSVISLSDQELKVIYNDVIKIK